MTFSYPTGRTVPFPYASPYPQQIALMDALLGSLQEVETASTACEEDKESRKQQQQKHQTRSHCPLFMLESPTGTGKSLSLASASIAWLRYREENDLQSSECHNRSRNTINPIATSSCSNSCNANNGPNIHRNANVSGTVSVETSGSRPSNTVTSNHTTMVDWVDDWVSPEENQRVLEDRMRKEQVRLVRSKLQSELRRIWSEVQESGGSGGTTLLSWRERATRMATSAARISHNHKRRRNIPKEVATIKEDWDLIDASTKPSTDSQPDEFDEFIENQTGEHLSPVARLLHGPYLDGSSVGKSKQTIGDVTAGSGMRKIIYAARTHTQLSQFVSELRRIPGCEDLRVVALGGRRALCGNKQLKDFSEAALNEACLDLQKNGTLTPVQFEGQKRTKRTGCPLLESRNAIDTLAIHTLAHPTDIEEAYQLGQASQTCAYYASRVAVPAAEVVVLPYSLLLSEASRQTVGLSLKQSLIVIDEAHNLPEAIRTMHTCSLQLPVLERAQGQLDNYVKRYADRLAGRSLGQLGQLRRIVLAIRKHLSGSIRSTSGDKKMRTATELLLELKIANINIFQLLSFMKQTRLSQKLLGFNPESFDETLDPQASLSKHVSAMSIVENFLEKLTLTGKEGKIITDWPVVRHDCEQSRASSPCLRYVLLQPSAYFHTILKEAHAVALVGGTLRPFVHLATELLGPYDATIVEEAHRADESVRQGGTKVSSALYTTNFSAFTCDHVVPSRNVLLQYWARGPSTRPLDFRYQSRSTDATMDELGSCILELCNHIPNGFVVFLPSYSYEAQLASRYRATGLWDKIEQIKCIYREPKRSQHVESTLQAFSSDAASKKGAVLFSVVGGKLSEGINFADEMARGVAVVGLPFPDVTDGELQEKMSLMDRSGGSVTGDMYYLNLCLRAVNQSVGRAIRHANDYAAIILLDQRYTTDTRIQGGLPGWLKKGLQAQHDFHSNISQLARFYADR